MKFLSNLLQFIRFNRGVSLIELNVVILGLIFFLYITFNSMTSVINQYERKLDLFKLQVTYQNLSEYIYQQGYWFWNTSSTDPLFIESSNSPHHQLVNEFDLDELASFSIQSKLIKQLAGQYQEVPMTDDSAEFIQVDIRLESLIGQEVTGSVFMPLTATQTVLDGMMRFIQNAHLIYYDMNARYPNLVGTVIPSIISILPNDPFTKAHNVINFRENRFDWGFYHNTSNDSVTLRSMTHPDKVITWYY